MMHTYLGTVGRYEARANAIGELGQTVETTERLEAEGLQGLDKASSTLPLLLNAKSNTPNFSNRLIHLMQQCCWTDAEDRITPVDLRDRVEEEWPRLTQMVGDFEGRSIDERLRLRFPKDAFPMNKSWKERTEKKKRHRDQNEQEAEDQDDARKRSGKRVKSAGLPEGEQHNSDELEAPEIVWKHRAYGEYDTEESLDDRWMSEVSDG
jgi:hypothetical protein